MIIGTDAYRLKYKDLHGEKMIVSEVYEYEKI